ncbi:MAG: lipopolysaccharide transport system ATP-binding protein [Chloroflexota bacterium]|nr:lipopolysaccharide transport system ATP-binding protein [Chloroflexota bacterium]
MKTVIEFADVSKKFTLDYQRSRSLQDTIINAFRRQPRVRPENFWALREVCFQVGAGESVALIGTNGSGKSTALKLISCIIQPTSGTVSAHGRVAALLELGAGFHPDLTGRENILLNGSILGLSRGFVRRQTDEIIAFSELERFIDVPVRNYSSGMMMRLGFSVATAFQPEILLIDEVLAVGDQAFQDRCLRRIHEIQRGGATIVMVSHDLNTVQMLCDRAIWLDDGRLCADGAPAEVAARYLTDIWQQEERRPVAAADTDDTTAQDITSEAASVSDSDGRSTREARWGSGEVRIERAEMLDSAGRETTVVKTGDQFVIRMWYNAPQRVGRPAFGVSFYDEQGNRINGPNTVWAKLTLPFVQGSGYVDYIVEALPLLIGRYDVTVAVYDEYVTHPYDHWDRMCTLSVVPGDWERQDGVVHIPCRWQHVPTG